MKKAILVVSFGTTHLDTLGTSIEATEEPISPLFPSVRCTVPLPVTLSADGCRKIREFPWIPFLRLWNGFRPTVSQR